jgi:hypothetical protein
MKPAIKKIIAKLSQEDNRIELSEAKAKALMRKFTKIEDELRGKINILFNLETKTAEARKLKIQADQEVKETYKIMGEYIRGKEEFNQIYDDFDRQAKDLGIKVYDIPIVQQLEKAFDKAANAYRPAQGLASEVNKFVEGR